MIFNKLVILILNFQGLSAWDVPYFTHKVKKAWLQLGSGAEFAPFLSLGACMEGLDNLLHSLYNIRLVNDEMEHGEAWSPEVYKLAGNALVHNCCALCKKCLYF